MMSAPDIELTDEEHRLWAHADRDQIIVALREAVKQREILRHDRDVLLAKVDELQDDRRRALKRAYEVTLDCQTCDEAVADLVRIIREARRNG